MDRDGAGSHMPYREIGNAGNKTPPGQIIDGDLAEIQAEEVVARALQLQGLSTALLVGRTIRRAETMGTDAIFAVELDDGSRFSFKMLSFDPPVHTHHIEQPSKSHPLAALPRPDRD